MNFLFKPIDDLTLTDGLWLAAVALAVMEPVVGIPIFIVLLFIQYGAKPTGKAIAATAKGLWKVGTFLMASRRQPLSPIVHAPSKADLMATATQRYEEECEIIDAMPLKKHEKEAMKLQARQKLIKAMWDLMQCTQ